MQFSSVWGSAPVSPAAGGFTLISLRRLGGSTPRTPKQPPYYEFLATRMIAATWIRPLSLWPKHYVALPPSCISLNTMNNHLAIKKCPLL